MACPFLAVTLEAVIDEYFDDSGSECDARVKILIQNIS